MANLIFNQRVKHGHCDLHPGIVYGFEDPDAAPYFVACGWAEETAADAVVEFTADECGVDPETIFGTGPNRGQKVLGGEAE